MLSFALSALGVGKSVLTFVLTWLSRRSLAEIGCIVLGIACLVLFVGNRAEKRHSAKVEAQLVKCGQARHADQEAYRKAQADAQAQNKAHVAAKEAESKRITDDTQSAYARDRAELIRLRQQARANQGHSNGAGSPSPSAPTEGADADGLQLSPDEHLQASEIELRLMHLQNWVEKQLQLDPNR